MAPDDRHTSGDRGRTLPADVAATTGKRKRVGRMANSDSAQRTWSWTGIPSPESFRGPVASFWRGLGYQVTWRQNELTGERELEGQHREFRADLTQPAAGTVEVRCLVRFHGEPPAVLRANEVYHPEILLRLLGDALTKGFGPAARSVDG